MPRPNKIVEATGVMTLASIVLVVAALYLAKGVLIPLVLAVLLSFLLTPVCDWLERRGLNRISSVSMTAVLTFTLLGCLFWTAAVQITNLAPRIPEFRTNIETKLGSVNQYAVAALNKMISTAEDAGENRASSEQVREPKGTEELPYSVRVLAERQRPLQVFGGLFGTLFEVLGGVGVLVVLVVFFLFQREDLRDRFIHLVGRGQVTVTTQMLEDAAARVSSYLSTLFFLNVTFGLSIGTGLYFIGVPNAGLCGILAAAMRFIPYVGPCIAAVLPIGLSIASSPGWTATMLTIGLFAVLELFNNNLLEPWLYGKNSGVSSVAVILSAIFWAWLWGPLGLLLATPLTVCILVVGKHVPQLAFLETLLGSEPVFEPGTRLYQRLLAGDQEEAAGLFEDALVHMPLVEVYDTVCIPALELAERHWHLGEIDDDRHAFIQQCLREMIPNQGNRGQEAQVRQNAASLEENADLTDGTRTSRPGVLCLPARTSADEITALMVAQLMHAAGSMAQAVPATTPAAEMETLVEQPGIDVICISSTPPSALMHARSLCKRLRSRFPEVKLVVGLWNAQGDVNKAKQRIGNAAVVVTTLAEAQEHLRLPPASRLDGETTD